MADHDSGAAELIGTLMSANAEAAANTTNYLLKLKEDEIKKWAQDFAGLYDALERIPTMIRTSYVESQLAGFEWVRERASKILNTEET